MEVYTAAYDFGLNAIMAPAPLIIEGDAFASIMADGRPILYFGSGAEKAQNHFAACPQASFVPGVDALAVDMIALADRDHMLKKFIDTAYSTPLYLKDFQATKPKNKVL